MVDLSPYAHLIEKARLSLSNICVDPRSAFLDVLQDKGFKPPKILRLSEIDRIDGPEDKQNKKSGWYIYHEISDDNGEGYVIGIACFGDWKTGINETWCSKSLHVMSTQERLNYHIKKEALQAAQQAETLKRNLEAAEHAGQIYASAGAANTHPYYDKKKIKAIAGLKLANDGRLMVPVYDSKNQIISLQFIDENGEKRFLTGGRTKGGFFLISGTNDFVICEGLATGASIHESTGFSVYVAFNAGNLFEVAAIVKQRHEGCRIIIAGDDDTKTAGNPGKTKAMQAAGGIGADVVFPDGVNDFNDLHVAQGKNAVKKYFSKTIVAYEKEENKEELKRPSGILNDIVSYYNATSGNSQPGFAIQTALAVCSIVLSRSFKTSMENFTSLYLLNVGKSSTGKEHAKTVVEKILYAANLGYLISGDGYTSAGAVFSALLDRPRHISVIDEFGRYLEAGRDLKHGSVHQREANTKLMESIGRAHSVIRPPTYSTMTIKKDAAEGLKNRTVHNPAITLLTMTTPDTLFKTLDMGAIRDGFINRFIISISNAERTLRKHKPPVDVPQNILDWIETVQSRYEKPHIASDPASPVILEFSEEAYKVQEDFQNYCLQQANTLERFGMAELPGRSNEMAMRISLIHALARSPNTNVIEKEDMDWAIYYVKRCLDETIKCLKISISSSDFEGNKKEILNDLRDKGIDGMTWAQMQKNTPYSKHKPKDLRDILYALKDADLVDEEPYTSEKGGRPTTKWIAVK